MASLTDKDRALSMLAKLNTPSARSAALRVMTNHEGAKGALTWVERAGLPLDEFDADGKLAYLMNEPATEGWRGAIETASKIRDEDFEETPVLYHAVAMTCLIQAVPQELRTSVASQVPFEADRFPLASDEAAMNARRKAASLCSKVSNFAQSMGIAAAANVGSDYALWLKLRDPRDHEQALDELR